LECFHDFLPLACRSYGRSSIAIRPRLHFGRLVIDFHSAYCAHAIDYISCGFKRKQLSSDFRTDRVNVQANRAERTVIKASPTIQDVARLANVSTATVSRSLSSPGRVAEETRRLVIDAVRSTGYQVNLTARNLRRRQAGAIVVLVPYIGNPFFSQILAGIETTASKSGLHVLIADTRQPHA